MLTRDEILAVYAAGPEAVISLVEQLQQALAALTARVEELENRLRKDSHNSHKPPSSDGLARGKKPKSLRGKSGKKSGGQPGHPGQTLRPVERPDEHRLHAPAACAHCGSSLEEVVPSSTQKRQVFDLPPLSLVVTEHEAQTKRCPHCQECTSGTFPEGVTQAAQYGPGILALSVYLQTYQLLPYARTQELLQDLFRASPCQGTLATALEAASQRLAPVEEGIRQALRQAAVVHFDETGIRAQAKLHWLHTAGTEQCTFYAVHQEMKQEVEWARTAGATALSPSRLRALEARYRRILEHGSAAHPPSPPSGKGGRRKQSPSRNLLNRLATHRAAVLGFLYDFAVPFDNNLAERDLRMVKVQQKISGGFRSAEGALIFCRIRGYISTLRKQGLHVLSALQSVFLGSPLMPQLQG
jgi:transposase